jgi:hypothetical protein
MATDEESGADPRLPALTLPRWRGPFGYGRGRTPHSFPRAREVRGRFWRVYSRPARVVLTDTEEARAQSEMRSTRLALTGRGGDTLGRKGRGGPRNEAACPHATADRLRIDALW